MRPAAVIVTLLALAALLVAASLGRSWQLTRELPQHRHTHKELVRLLGLTDLALFTEARYTRHPSQADMHAAWQDHPGALEHFPTGSLIRPPLHLTIDHATLAGKTGSPD